MSTLKKYVCALVCLCLVVSGASFAGAAGRWRNNSSCSNGSCRSAPTMQVTVSTASGQPIQVQQQHRGEFDGWNPPPVQPTQPPAYDDDGGDGWEPLFPRLRNMRANIKARRVCRRQAVVQVITGRWRG